MILTILSETEDSKDLDDPIIETVGFCGPKIKVISGRNDLQQGFLLTVNLRLSLRQTEPLG